MKVTSNYKNQSHTGNGPTFLVGLAVVHLEIYL